ncbi:MAG: energy-coupling factor ABC transporter ATP-binding protein [Thermoplasmatales archaeon]|nr:energy-coupling factor ABC transporter ATP-binding protein [Thermoplasmatales archaeon]
MIKIKDLTFVYAGNKKSALNDISLSIDDSEFILLTGPSGCGKSTLCRCINGLIPSFYGGKIQGSVEVQDIDVFQTPTREMAKKVGMVFQDPENQLVATDVEREIAFGLENLGLPKTIMAKRIEEVLDTVGIDHLRHRQLSTLSGGEKQKTVIAAVLVLHPEVLVLDEPTSELDPKGAEEVIQLIKRLNEELGLTIILVEHRIDRVLQSVDRIIVMKKGIIHYDDHPRKWIDSAGNALPDVGIPPIARLGVELKQKNIDTQIPLTIKEGRQVFSSIFKSNKWKEIAPSDSQRGVDINNCVAKVKNLWYKYPDGPTVLRDINLSISKEEFISIVGRNAAGKTTLVKLLTGLLKPSKGKIEINDINTTQTTVENLSRYVGYVFQDPNVHLFADTVEEEITFMAGNLGFSPELIEQSLEKMLKKFNLEYCRHKYPRSLSSGEKQRVALASVVAAHPQILILDEPTRGLDYELKKSLVQYLVEYKRGGGTILLITHDIELIAEFGERVILMSEGKIVADGNKHQVLANSLHFSPQINRLIQPFTKYGISSDTLTVDEIMQEFQ